jgi:hypothetical protein
MKKLATKQIGPNSLAGKKIASKNAQKGSIFSRGYLESENPKERQAQFDRLCEQWGAYDPSRQILLRSIEEAVLGSERMMVAIRQKIEGRMQSLDITREFANQAGINPVLSMSLPTWYFKEDSSSHKVFAQTVYDAWIDAHTLKDRYSDQLSAHIAQQFPALYSYVMDDQKQGTVFSTVLGQRYRQTTPLLNLSELIKEIDEKYRFHIIWAQDAERFEIIIAGIRAAQMLDVMDLEKTNRYATGFQNRILKGIHGLAIIDQYEAKAVQILQAPPLETVDEDESVIDTLEE